MKWLNKDKIKFISLIEGVEETMPVISAATHKYNWVKKCVDDLKENGSILNRQANQQHLHKTGHTSKCPGIFAVKNKGFIVRTHSDIKLKIEGNQYGWQTPHDWRAFSGSSEETISHHFQDSLHKFMSDWPKDTLETPLKIGLPWMIKIPKGWEVLMVDPFYKDDIEPF